MTNWPKIQEYRNFEAKFFDNPKKNDNLDSSTADEEESVLKNRIDSQDSMDVLKTSDLKTVRCVIRKDFEETLKKFDRGDGLTVGHEIVRSKTQEAPVKMIADMTAIDQVRLQNHLKWKKQKEEEYMQKKEAERAALQKKKEQEIHMEKIKKLKEKEREEKLKQWEEQKTREKESKKRENMLMKVLQAELKEVTPAVDKEKLIEEWVKLKDKQRQMEAEKKAVMLKKEEEHRALRQNLAALSYRQWKERLKGRTMALPKNGYQIFGPKPIPVVKEDWNHNFTASSPRHQVIDLKTSRSNISSFCFRPEIKEFENISRKILGLGEIKNKSFCNLKNKNSGLNLTNYKHESEMPLKELQPGTISANKNAMSDCKSVTTERISSNLVPRLMNSNSYINFFTNSYLNDRNLNKFTDDLWSNLMYSSSNEEEQNHYCSALSNRAKNLSELTEVRPNNNSVPIKKKLDLYINPPRDSVENFRIKCQKKATSDNECTKAKESKRLAITQLNCDESSAKNKSTKKKGSPHRVSKQESLKVTSDIKLLGKSKSVLNNVARNTQYDFGSQKKNKINRRSRSHDKPLIKNSQELIKNKGSTSSKSSMKVNDHCSKESKTTTSEYKLGQSKKKLKKPSKSNIIPGGNLNEKNSQEEGETKSRRKFKKKSSMLTKSLSFTDSPYCSKKVLLKIVDKTKGAKKKCDKDGETKSDVVGQRRKSTTKVT